MRTPALVAVALILAAGTATPAVADPSAPPGQPNQPVAQGHVQRAAVPTSGVMTINGHGWGHGHGVSQWGAEGGAELGVTADQMLAAYYPGTVAAAQAPRSLRVWISTDDGTDTVVWPADGLAVTDLAGARTDAATANPATALPTGAAYARWRAVPVSGQLAVQSSPDGTAWTTYAPLAALTGPVRFSDSAALLRLGLPGGISRSYRGTLSAVLSGPQVLSVDTLDVEDYLRGVVPREAPSSWLPAALQVQAVAARSYATYTADHAPAAQAYDICDSDSCQVYSGATSYSATGVATRLEVASTDQAVLATAHLVRSYQGAAAFTQFSSSDGGWTSAGSQPYLDAHADPWDGVDPGNTGHSWTATLTADEIESRYPSIGTLQSVQVTQRDGNGDWGGRIAKVLLQGVDSSGASTSVQATGFGIYQAHSWPASSDGLRSEWWQIVGAADTVVPTVQPPGFVPLTPVTVMESGRFPLRSGSSRRVLVGVPSGATALLVNVVAKGGSTTRGSLLVGPSGGRQVAVVALKPHTTASGQVLVPAPKDGKLIVGVSSGSAGVRVQVVGVVRPGGGVLSPVSPVKALPVKDGQVTLPATAPTALLGVLAAPGRTVTVGGVQVVGAGSVLVVPGTAGTVPVVAKGLVSIVLLATPGALSATASGVASILPRATTSAAGPHPSYVSVSGARAGQTLLLHVSATVTTKVWPAGTKSPIVLVPSGSQTNLVLTLKTGRLLVQTTGGGGTITVVPMASLSR